MSTRLDAAIETIRKRDPKLTYTEAKEKAFK